MEQLLKDMESYAMRRRVPIINAGGKETLLTIAAEKKAQRILEIGTAIGYSTLLLASHSAPNAEITTIELDEARADVAEAFIARSAFTKRIRILRGDAAVRMEALQGPYDLVFIDAAKGQYPLYFEKALPLLADGGFILADNVLFRGMVKSDEKVPHRYRTIVTRLRAYIETVENHPEFETKIYEAGDGLAVSRHRRNLLEKT